MLDKSLALLGLIARDGGATPLSTLAARLDLPHSTARRMVTTLRRHGFVLRSGHGRYEAGEALRQAYPATGMHRQLAARSRAPLRRLSRMLGATTHLGIFETDMVTYIVREGTPSPAVFTREGEQLEAYCSGIGKVLLAHLEEGARAAYLAGGPFVPLTSRTIVDPHRLDAELAAVREQGFAIDDGEIAEDIFCIAVPVGDPAGSVHAAISATFTRHPDEGVTAILASLRATADRIGSEP